MLNVIADYLDLWWILILKVIVDLSEIIVDKYLKSFSEFYLELCWILILKVTVDQGSKIELVRSYLRVPQDAGQVKILIVLVKITFFPIGVNIIVMQGKCLF